MTQQLIERLKELLSTEQIYEQEPMKNHTTFRVGGPAEILVTPQINQVAAVVMLCKKAQVPYIIIGNGSNLLVSDQGLDGVVIELGRQASDIRAEGCMIIAEAGAMLSKVSNLAAQSGLSGMEFASGIPGTIGGAVAMNAGAYGGEMSQIVKRVTVLTESGENKAYSSEEMDFSYRHSRIFADHDIVLTAELLLQEEEPAQIFARMHVLREQRTAKQPLDYPSAGSTFKRPEGYFAGKLIMDAGLGGYSVGDAQVSEKHCGFVINKGNATAEEIAALMNHVQEAVKKQFGVELEPEVRKLGEFA